MTPITRTQLRSLAKPKAPKRKRKSVIPQPESHHEELFARTWEMRNAAQSNTGRRVQLEREHRFDDTMRRLDFAHVETKVAAEIHGMTRGTVRGRHVAGDGFEADRRKMNDAQMLGWLVLEFTGDMVQRDPLGCVSLVLAAIDKRGPQP